MKAMVLSPNGILFILDPTNGEAEVPMYEPGRLAVGTESCISVATQAGVDGPTEVVLGTDQVLEQGLHLYYRGFVATPGGFLAVVTSQFERLLQLDVATSEVEVAVWADDAHSASRVAVAVVALRRSVLDLISLGPLPEEGDAEPAQLRAFEAALSRIAQPVSDHEAVALLSTFPRGEGSSFGLAWSLLHLVESAPGWPCAEAQAHKENPWVQSMLDRAS